jgi:hypothetical protein
MSVLRPSGVRRPQGAIYVISLKGWIKVFSLRVGSRIFVKGGFTTWRRCFITFRLTMRLKIFSNNLTYILPYDDVEVNDLSVALSLCILIRRMLTYAVRPASFDL